jgi:hypothetical protein
MSTPKMSKTRAVASFTRRIQGLQSLPAKQAILINGETYTVAQAIKIFQATLDALAAVAPQEVEYRRAVASYHEALEAAQALDPGLKQWAFTLFGNKSQQATALGYEARKVATKSVDTLQRAAEKAKATRQARGTLGRKARLKVKGTVTVLAASAQAPAIRAA